MNLKKIIFSICVFTGLDLLIKYLVSNYVTDIVIIKNFFSLTYVLNEGIAFSILDGYGYLIIIITVIILLYLLSMMKRSLTDKLITFGYTLLISGLLGNFIDRLLDFKVVDYLSFRIFNYNFPVFNLADILIVLGAFLIIFKEFEVMKNDRA